jgi:hypothetical protein
MLPQYCCVVHALECAQQCLEQIRHNMFSFKNGGSIEAVPSASELFENMG